VCVCVCVLAIWTRICFALFLLYSYFIFLYPAHRYFLYMSAALVAISVNLTYIWFRFFFLFLFLAKQQELAKQKLHVWRKREWEKDMGVPLLIWNIPFWGNYLWEFRFIIITKSGHHTFPFPNLVLCLRIAALMRMENNFLYFSAFFFG